MVNVGYYHHSHSTDKETGSRRLTACSALEGESEVRQGSAGLFLMGLCTFRLVLRAENALPQDIILGLYKKVIRTSR